MSKRNPTLRRLMIFEAALRLGSISAAARQLALSQPAATHALGKLEAEIGVRLIERGARGSRATALGRIMQRRTERMLRRIETSLAEFAFAVAESPDRLMRRLTDVHVRCHLAIAETSSFRNAAAMLQVAEPTLHRGARSLEDVLAAPLYQRGPGGIEASRSGLQLATNWRVALREIEQGLDEIDAAQGIAAGRLSLGCLPLMPKTVLARAVAELLRSHPNSAISVEESTHLALSQKLRRGDIDLLLGALRSEPPEDGTRQRRLFDDPYFVVARRQHPLSTRTKIRKADLADSPWVIPWHDTPRRVVLERLFDGLPRRPQTVVETSSLAMMAVTLAESDCLGLLARSQIEEQEPLGTLIVLPVRLSAPERAVGVTYRDEWLPTGMQDLFVEILVRQTQDIRRHARRP